MSAVAHTRAELDIRVALILREEASSSGRTMPMNIMSLQDDSGARNSGNVPSDIDVYLVAVEGHVIVA